MKRWLIAVCLLFPSLAVADAAGVLRLTTEEPLDRVYGRIHSALEAELGGILDRALSREW